MARRTPTEAWPVLRQLGGDLLGRGHAARSRHDRRARPPARATADRVVDSVCPYCAVGCAQKVYVKDEKVVQIEGDDDSPVSRGRLCPKGSATLQLTTGDSREHFVLHRRPFSTAWERLDLDTAMSMVADRLVAARADGWQDVDDDGHRLNRTMGVASLGGATLDNEENYLIKKLFTGLGIVQMENQARVCHSSTVVALGTTFGRGGSTTCAAGPAARRLHRHRGQQLRRGPPGRVPVGDGGQAPRRPKIIHVDPRFTRTSAVADKHVPIRAGSDIALLGGRHQLRARGPRRVVPRVRAALHERRHPGPRGLPGHRGARRGVLRPRGRARAPRPAWQYDEVSWQYDGSVVAVQPPAAAT